MDSIGCTFNLNPMFIAAGLRVRELNGVSCMVAMDQLRAAINIMEDEPAKMRALDPPNGWGDYASGLEFLREVRAMCVAHPGDVLVVT